jgi:hypothetical protein
VTLEWGKKYSKQLLYFLCMKKKRM